MPRHDPHGANAPEEDRREALVRATFEVIAERGFEGLRTREVAGRVGVNVATLHYYFPTKEALIVEVVGYITRAFEAVHAAPVAPSAWPALDRLRQEFADTRAYRFEHSEITTVVRELAVRARRDARIAGALDTLLTGWGEGLRQILAEGVDEGVFQPDLDVAAMAKVMQAFLWGAGAPGLLDADDLEQAFGELERLLVRPEIRD